MSTNKNDKRNKIPNSSEKMGYGSRSVHSEKDNSTQDGVQPPRNKEEE